MEPDVPSLNDVEECDDSAVARHLVAPEDAIPDMTSPAWNDYVMRKFAEDELDPNGRPLTAGLRRVCLEVLGPLIESRPVRVVQMPEYAGGILLKAAAVEYQIVVEVTRPEGGTYLKTVGDVGEVNNDNCDEFFRQRHALTTATTRAEARCLRKALLLRTIASDEATIVPPLEETKDGLIGKDQMFFLGALSKRCDINVLKFVNCGKKKYDRVADIPTATADKMLRLLSGYQTDPSQIPLNVRGYEDDWRGGNAGAGKG